MVPTLQNQKLPPSEPDLVSQQVTLSPGRTRPHLTAPPQALAPLNAIEAERKPFRYTTPGCPKALKVVQVFALSES